MTVTSRAELVYWLDHAEAASMSDILKCQSDKPAVLGIGMYAKATYATDQSLLEGLNIMLTNAPAVEALVVRVMMRRINERWDNFSTSILPFIKAVLMENYNVPAFVFPHEQEADDG